MSIPYRQTWTLQDALSLCTEIEQICPKYGCHVALTGGLLYKGGARKDCDILFYRIRQRDSIDHDGLFLALENIGIKKISDGCWVCKATFEGRSIDCFFPEDDGPDEAYPPVVDADFEIANPEPLCDKSTS